MAFFTDVVIGADHAGFNLKKILLNVLEKKGIPATDIGTFTEDSCDYPHIARSLCRRLDENPGQCGILVCGTGIGMSIAANRMPGIRAALCTNEFQARASRQHNNANVLCLGERITGTELAVSILETFLATEFMGGRHQRRVALIDE